MSAILTDGHTKSLSKLSKVWARLTLLGLILSIGAVTEHAGSPVSCERHAGSFGKGFSVDFDIDRIDCKASFLERSPVIQIWGVSPYVAVRWQ
jgi:heme A synthase